MTTETKTMNTTERLIEWHTMDTVKKEEELAAQNTDIKELERITVEKLEKMAAYKETGDELKRRELRNEVIVDNMRLVTVIVKKYGAFSPDRFQNGCIGLLRAAETFDPSVGVPFRNYACHCIEIEIRLAFKKQNRTTNGKKAGFLESLDGTMSLPNGDEVSRYDVIADPMAECDLDDLIDEAEIDTLFYKIIIPCIDAYGTRALGIDVALWRKLEIEYFIGLSMEGSQRQRMNLSDMAKKLGTTTQNMRTRHKKVVEMIRSRCVEYGLYVHKSPEGRCRIVHNYNDDTATATVAMRAKEQRRR